MGCTISLNLTVQLRRRASTSPVRPPRAAGGAARLGQSGPGGPRANPTVTGLPRGRRCRPLRAGQARAGRVISSATGPAPSCSRRCRTHPHHPAVICAVRLGSRGRCPGPITLLRQLGRNAVCTGSPSAGGCDDLGDTGPGAVRLPSSESPRVLGPPSWAATGRPIVSGALCPVCSMSAPGRAHARQVWCRCGRKPGCSCTTRTAWAQGSRAAGLGRRWRSGPGPRAGLHTMRSPLHWLALCTDSDPCRASSSCLVWPYRAGPRAGRSSLRSTSARRRRRGSLPRRAARPSPLRTPSPGARVGPPLRGSLPGPRPAPLPLRIPGLCSGSALRLPGLSVRVGPLGPLRRPPRDGCLPPQGGREGDASPLSGLHSVGPSPWGRGDGGACVPPSESALRVLVVQCSRPIVTVPTGTSRSRRTKLLRRTPCVLAAHAGVNKDRVEIFRYLIVALFSRLISDWRIHSVECYSFLLIF
jgi:hypothetical protein